MSNGEHVASRIIICRRGDLTNVLSKQTGIGLESHMPLTRRQTAPLETTRDYPANSLAALEKHYSVADLAKLWLFSENTVRRIFINEPGVLKLVHQETRYKRRYTSLRIPEHIAKQVHRRLQGAAPEPGQGASNGRRPVAAAAVRGNLEISA